MAQSSAGTRHSSRAKKPSRRAEEADFVETATASEGQTSTKTTAITKTKRQRRGKRQGARKASTRRAASASASEENKEDKDEEDGGEYHQEEDSGDDDEEEEAASAGPTSDKEDVEAEEEQERQASGDLYCLCQQGDDGRPMVFCAECNDWFHFKCVGLTKRVAEKLSEYICPPCGKKTGKKSRTIDDGDNEEEYADEAAKQEEEDSESETPAPPRRPSAALKRRMSDDDMPRKRSRSSPQSSANKKGARPTPPEPVRKTSGSITAPTGSTAVMKSRSETLRKHAVDQLVSTFDAIFEEQEGEDEAEDGQGRKYAVKFEASLFELNCETIARTTIRIAGKLYRDRLRTFLFNLKDKSNTSLRQKIASKELTAETLAAMDNDALANDDIRKEVERRKKENLEQSILKKEIAPLRKLTHKGEIDIDYEAAHMSRINAERESEKESSVLLEEQKAETSEVKGEATALSPVAKVAASFGSPTTSAPPRRLTASAQSPTLPFDFGNVWTGEETKVEFEGEEAERDGEAVNGEESIIAEGEVQAEVHADNFIDDFLGMPEEKAKTAQESLQVAEVPTDTGSTFKWRGLISMPEEGICAGKVRQVAGRALSDDEWKKLFPETHSVIEGRLPAPTAAPYLVQSKLALRTELVVMTFEASWEPEAIAQLAEGIAAAAPSNEDDNVQSFDKLLSYFHRRDRYGVLPALASAKGVLVKDFYITPLPKVGMIPQWMDMMQSSEFQGSASHTRDSDMFLLVAVLFKQGPIRPPNEAAFSPPQGTLSTPPNNLSSILGPGSNTLQDLLKAVGGSNTRSPATPLATAGYQSPSTQASTLDRAINQHQPSIDTLRDMPRPQLEEMMHNNPNLVDQLLKTLSATKAPSPSPVAARPPGPPPPPPPSIQRPPYQMPSSNGHHYNPYGNQASQPSSGYPPSSSYDYNYQAHPQVNQRPYASHAGYPPPPEQQQGWRPNPGYPPYQQASSPMSYNGLPAPPSHHNGPMPPANYGAPPVRGGYNRGGGPPPGQRRY